MKKVQKKAPTKAQKKILPKTQPPKTVSDENANRLRFFVERKDAMAETIRQLVEIESPSDNKQAVDRLGALLAGRFEGLAGTQSSTVRKVSATTCRWTSLVGAAVSRCCFWDTLTPSIRWELSPACLAMRRMGGCTGREYWI